MNEEELQRRILDAMRRITSAQEQELTQTLLTHMEPQQPPTEKLATPPDRREQ